MRMHFQYLFFFFISLQEIMSTMATCFFAVPCLPSLKRTHGPPLRPSSVQEAWVARSSIISRYRPHFFDNSESQRSRSLNSEKMAPVSMGSRGGGGGKEWNYVFQGGLKEIQIDSEGGYIKSMFFKDDHGYSRKYGSQQGKESYVKISLDCPSEYLVRIDGTHGQVWPGMDLIKSLTFVTNANTYGPYGTKNDEDTSFTISVKSGKEVVGFHGRCGDAINAIGILVATPRSPY